MGLAYASPILFDKFTGGINMLLFETQDKLMATDQTKPCDVKVGIKYMIAGVIERGIYKGSLNTYFKEYLYRNREIHLMTRFDGTKPFAIATNDCERDGFQPFHLSKIYVDQGNYIVYGYKLPFDKYYDPIKFVVFQVTNVQPQGTMGMDMMEVVALYKFSSIDTIPFQLFGAVHHAIEVFDCEMVEQLIPKYCFNPNRLVSLRLFERNEKNEVESFFNNGKKLILNANSKARLVDGEVTNGGLFRVFFSKKFRTSNVIFVDGKELTPLHKWDIDSYIAKSYLDEDVAHSMIRQVVTDKGNIFYAVTNLSGEFRPIYKSSGGYLSFPLSRPELAFIKDVRDI